MTEAEIDAAMCMWEAVLCAESTDSAPEWFKVYREENGVCGARHLIRSLAPDIEALWLSMDADDPSAVCGAFDWEFCPAVLDLMHNHYTLPTKEELLAHFNFIAGE